MARAVPKKCSDSETAINPLRENSTPTRHTSGSDCFARGAIFVISFASSVTEQCKRLRTLSQYCDSPAHWQLFGILGAWERLAEPVRQSLPSRNLMASERVLERC
jgi:hypothetical protein